MINPTEADIGRKVIWYTDDHNVVGFLEEIWPSGGAILKLPNYKVSQLCTVLRNLDWADDL